MPVRRVREKVGTSPRVSVIIPSRDGDRGGNVARLLEALDRQTFQDFEVLLVRGERPNGHARNVGVKDARGEIFVFIDDDAILGDESVLEHLVSVFVPGSLIGMAGASTLISPGSTWFQRWVAREDPRAHYPLVQEATDTLEGATHLCCAIPREAYEQLGGESDVLETGTDVDMRDRVRQTGYRVVLAPRCYAYHPQPRTLSQAVHQWWWYGSGGPLAARVNPRIIVRRDFPSPVHATAFLVFRLLWILPNTFLRLERRPAWRIGLRVAPLAALRSFVQASGYVHGWYALRKQAE